MAKKDAKQAPKDNKVAKPASSGKAAGQSATDAEGFSASEFAQGTREELAKVIWPTRQQLISESAAVILMVGLSATLIYFIDKLFGWASRQVF
ncbi:MAG: preprotein translocase subunit SecE [Phormidesmis sp. RL_2_1]|nr:preprotein translocase subunit SecE [Phormidesmis sp. RL_2_1]